MKKIVISAVIGPLNPSVTMETVESALRMLGSVNCTFMGEMEIASAAGLARSVWVFVSGDDAEPYSLATGFGDKDGDELTSDAIDNLRAHGVCTEFHVVHARADRYGTPLYAANEDFAAAEVGEHLFRVTDTGFLVDAQDRGDDGGTEIWLKIALPEPSPTKVAEWCGLHYKVNFEAESKTSQEAWINRFMEVHEFGSW